ncbi:MAG: hypothetical protein ACTSVI_07775 [Promethearchaeota archaeon]
MTIERISEGNKDLINKRNFYKAFNLTMAITVVLFAGIISVMTYDHFIGHPKVSTSNYHFNVQYRVGNPSAMDDVVNNSLLPILEMYNRHPKWKANIEFQSQMLEWMAKMDARAANGSITFNGGINSSLDLLRNLLNRGQIELVTVQYSSALAIAYPYYPFYKSINYTQKLFEDYNINKSAVCRAVLLQEGQFMLGFSRVIQDFHDSSGHPLYDAILTTRESLSYFHVSSVAPLYKWQFREDPYSSSSRSFGSSVIIVPWWISPQVEGNVVHHNLWCQDGENVATGETVTWEDSDFSPNPEKVRNHERRLQDLENQGNIFLTLTEWMKMNEDKIKSLDSYVPETHWQVFNYRSSYVWMGKGAGGYIDDGLLLARNYKTYQVLQGVEILLNYSYFKEGCLNHSEYVQLYGQLTRAWMNLADSMVTDITGLSPRDYENTHALLMTDYAVNNATAIKDYIMSKPSSILNSSGFIQVLPFNFSPLVNWTGENLTTFNWNDTIISNSSDFVSFSLNGNASETKLPMQVETLNVVDYNITKNTLNAPRISNLDGLQYFSLKLNFKKYNSSDQYSNAYIRFIGDFSKIRYSPSLYENETILLNRSAYYPDLLDAPDDLPGNIDPFYPDNFEIYLPISNGLIYSVNGGFAIVKNNTASHICAKWNENDFRFMQDKTKNQSLPVEFFMLNNVSLATAVDFANLINTFAAVNISGGVLNEFKTYP